MMRLAVLLAAAMLVLSLSSCGHRTDIVPPSNIVSVF